MSNIPAESLEVLRGATISVVDGGTEVVLNSGQLDKGTYGAVHEVLARVGGKWVGRRKRHEFPYDATPVLESVIASGEMPPKNPLAFFPTPADVVALACDRAHLDSLEFDTESRVVEPSGGTGAFVRELVARGLKGRVDTVEMDPLKVRGLRQLEAGEVYEGDFMEWEPVKDTYYSRFIMNPPFSGPGAPTLYIDHIMKAWDIVGNEYGCGTVVAIAPTSWMTCRTKEMAAFFNHVAINGSFEMLPAQSFKGSGTTVDTCIITLDRSRSESELMKPTSGYRNYFSFQFYLTTDNSPSEYAGQVGAIKELARTDVSAAKLALAALVSVVRDDLLKSEYLLASTPEVLESIWLDGDFVEEVDTDEAHIETVSHEIESDVVHEIVADEDDFLLIHRGAAMFEGGCDVRQVEMAF